MNKINKQTFLHFESIKLNNRYDIIDDWLEIRKELKIHKYDYLYLINHYVELKEKYSNGGE
jgi:hypothetical protein